MPFEEILKYILTFVFGGSFLGVLNWALGLRKQKKDEFIILRETWKAQFDDMTAEIKKLKGEIQDLRDELEAANAQKMIYQEKLKKFLDGME